MRYYSTSQAKIATALVSIVPVIETTGAVLFQTVKKEVWSIGLDLKDCIGFGSDGINANIGEHNYVYSRLREVSPNIVLLRCTCHSLALGVEKAFDIMPANIGYMLRRVPAWFSNSSMRKDMYKTLFETLQDSGDQSTTNPAAPFQKYSQTRWLCRGKVPKNILDQWLELSTYFECTAPVSDQEKHFDARTLKDMFKDELTRLHFVFLTPIVQEFEQVNAGFQTNECNPEKLFNMLNQLHLSLKSRLYRAGEKLSLSRVEFGARFISESTALAEKVIRGEARVSSRN